MKGKVALITVIILSVIAIIALIPKRIMLNEDAWVSTSWTVYTVGWELKVVALVAIIGLVIYTLKKRK